MEQMSMTEILHRDGKCCITGQPMHTSRHLNFVALDYTVEWPHPYEHNVLMKDRPKRALAIIHDDAYDATKKYVMPGLVKFAIEIRGTEIIYHPCREPSTHSL